MRRAGAPNFALKLYFLSAYNPRETVRVRTEQGVPRKWETDAWTEETGLCSKGGGQMQHGCLVTLFNDFEVSSLTWKVRTGFTYC